MTITCRSAISGATGLAVAIAFPGARPAVAQQPLPVEKLYQDVLATSRRGSELDVSSTPTFFVNGQEHVGALSLARFKKVLEPLLAAKTKS